MPFHKGFTHTKRTKLKMSMAHKGTNGWTGRKHSKRTKKLMSLKRTGADNPMFGKKHSEETKKKMRDAGTKK
jgi:group I intron endonuclease